MNDLLKSKLEILAEDELTLKALRELFDIEIDKLKPDIDKTNDNKILGEKYRATQEAEKLIKEVFENINSYKQQRSSNKKSNRGK